MFCSLSSFLETHNVFTNLYRLSETHFMCSIKNCSKMLSVVCNLVSHLYSKLLLNQIANYVPVFTISYISAT